MPPTFIRHAWGKAKAPLLAEIRKISSALAEVMHAQHGVDKHKANWAAYNALKENWFDPAIGEEASIKRVLEYMDEVERRKTAYPPSKPLPPRADNE